MSRLKSFSPRTVLALVKRKNLSLPYCGKKHFLSPVLQNKQTYLSTKSNNKEWNGRSYSADHFSLSRQSRPCPWFYQLWSLPLVLPVSSTDQITGSLYVCAEELYLPDERLLNSDFRNGSNRLISVLQLSCSTALFSSESLFQLHSLLQRNQPRFFLLIG